MSDEQNRRQFERHAVEHRIEVINQFSGGKLGDLVNIHAEGLMLASESVVAVDNVYQVVVKPSGMAEAIGEFGLGLDCLWVRDMSQDEGCWAGFRIVSGSSDAQEKIEQIVGLFDQQLSVSQR